MDQSFGKLRVLFGGSMEVCFVVPCALKLYPDGVLGERFWRTVVFKPSEGQSILLRREIPEPDH